MINKTIGIIGGMGPLATADLFEKIISNTKAETDQEHFHVIIDNNTNIPDRTNAVLYDGSDPIPEMIRSAKLLESRGAECLIMPCNTAHYFYNDIAKAVHVDVLNMIDITCKAIVESGYKRAGLLATTGTIKTGVYARSCEKYGIDLLVPDDSHQVAVMDMIYKGIKAGKTEYDCSIVNDGVKDMLDRGAEVIILGCTELPLAYKMYQMHFSFIDPTNELAKAAIINAGGVERLK